MKNKTINEELRNIVRLLCEESFNNNFLQSIERILVEDEINGTRLERILIEIYQLKSLTKVSELVNVLCTYQWIYSIEEYVRFISWACVHEYLSQVSGAGFLHSISYPDRDDLGDQYKGLLAVADLVMEDSEEGFKPIEGDGMFISEIVEFYKSVVKQPEAVLS